MLAQQLHPLATQSEIRRTTYGVPHILARNLEAAGFALAWVQLEDYGDRVPEGLVAARGELSMWRGEVGDIESDFGNRPWFDRAAASFHLLDADTRAVYRGFAAGVTEYVRQNRARIPDWLPTTYWPHDVLARDMVRIGSSQARDFMRRIGAEGEPAGVSSPEPRVDMAVQYPVNGRAGAIHGADVDVWTGVTGSNAWAIAPGRTASGHAILLRNPHLSWDAGYYEAHVTVPGVIDFYGDFRIGGPFGIIGGFNANLGWATTNNAPDLDEIYSLEADPDRPDHYLFDGGSVPLTRTETTVSFRNGPGLARETRESWSTPLGPVIHRGNGRIYVLKSGGAGDYRLGQQFLAMMRANNLDEWKDAMRMRARTSSNFTYADRDGNIFYVWNATIPSLPHASGGDTIAVPARRTADVWTRIASFDSLPQLLNPPGGYLHNENDPFHFANPDRVLRAQDYPSWYPAPALSLRGQHSIALLENTDRLSLEDVIRLKHSYRMLLAERVKDDLVGAVRAASAQGDVAAAVDIIEAWDGTVAPDSRGGVLFEEWWMRYWRSGLGPDAPPTSQMPGSPWPATAGWPATASSAPQLFAVPWNADDPLAGPRGLGDPDRAVRSFAEAVRSVSERWGSADVAWGAVHRVRVGDVDVPVGGCTGALGCFRVLGYGQDEDGLLSARTGDGWVLAVEFGDEPRAFSILAYGQSSDSVSPHHDDQAAMFARGEMKPVAFSSAAIEASLIQRYRPGQPRSPGN